MHLVPSVRDILVGCRCSPRLEPRAIVQGRTFLHGEVFHSYGEWAELSAGGADEKQIEESIRRTHSEKKGNEWFWNNLAKGLGMANEDAQKLSLEEFCKNLTPGLLWGHLLPQQTQNLSILFLAYRLFERDALARGLTEQKARELYGEPPWDLLNHILEASGLPFRVTSPEMVRPIRFSNTGIFLLPYTTSNAIWRFLLTNCLRARR